MSIYCWSLSIYYPSILYLSTVLIRRLVHTRQRPPNPDLDKFKQLLLDNNGIPFLDPLVTLVQLSFMASPQTLQTRVPQLAALRSQEWCRVVWLILQRCGYCTMIGTTTGIWWSSTQENCCSSMDFVCFEAAILLKEEKIVSKAKQNCTIQTKSKSITQKNIWRRDNVSYHYDVSLLLLRL